MMRLQNNENAINHLKAVDPVLNDNEVQLLKSHHSHDPKDMAVTMATKDMEFSDKHHISCDIHLQALESTNTWWFSAHSHTS